VKSLIGKLNKVFDNRVRLGIMSALAVNESLEFNTLKALLGVTDGNLASHLAVLERCRYLRVHKEFVGRKPQTTYAMSETGRRAFSVHLDGLEELIRKAL
jgi:DNA-binding HxlR family transcriptional regulator